MTFARDPLSERYDELAGTRLGEAIARRGNTPRQRWIYSALPRPDSSSARAARFLTMNAINLDATDKGGLTTYQRAYQRSLYWNAKQLGISSTDAEWCLQVQWGPDTKYGRQVGIRLVTRAEALRHVRRKPKSARWDLTPAARSGAAADGQEKTSA